ncbi:uncharacterized protein LOC127814277 isoform X2 [Diospyros lotus]|uniref:uncharacterized protein LOC127814277 isoform X2 n=1 Tax=Diospyros lotus TaxID=55363 RepID=UPI00224F8954|nr:uncharacterized protein LOC127814277 isoform X2 [Diospyros lotus]
MAEGGSPGILPAGWTEQIEIKDGDEIRCYFNMESGEKSYSINDIIHNVENANISLDNPEGRSKHDESSEHKQVPLAMEEKPEWLPEGWTVELKIQKSGRKYKCYVDPLSSRKFYSKPDVLGYLSKQCLNASSVSNVAKRKRKDMDASRAAKRKRKDMDASRAAKRKDMDARRAAKRKDMDARRAAKQKDMDASRAAKRKRKDMDASTADLGELSGGKTPSKLEGSKNVKTSKVTSRTAKRKKKGLRKESAKKFKVEMAAPDGLPPGWKKEIRTRGKGNASRKDPYYTDPVNGYVFRSKKDALRYLESGDFSKCAIKPKKRGELKFLD